MSAPLPLNQAASEVKQLKSRRDKNNSRSTKKRDRSGTVRWMLTWLAAAAVLAVYSYIEIRRDYYGQVYEGQIVGKRIITVSRHRGIGTREKFYIQYTYDPDGSRQWAEERVDWHTYEQIGTPSKPGLAQKVKVKAVKVLGTYFERYFLTEYVPQLGFIVLLATASAGCASFSLYCLCSALSHPPPRKRPTRKQRAQWRRRDLAPGSIPNELQQPLPRRVWTRRMTRGFDFFMFLPLGLVGAYLLFLAVRAAMSAETLLVIVLSPVGLILESFWLWLAFEIFIKPPVEKRLCQWGVPVAGRIVRKWQRTWYKQPTRYLEYQYDHPGLGQRKKSVAVWPKQFNDAAEGESVTVLCYPNRRWPTRVYEYANLFRCW
jgi:hypothetical protein